MKGLNLSKFHKMADDGKSVTMIHKDGHKIIIAKSALSPIHQKQLEALPMHEYAKGGKVMHYDKGTSDAEPPPEASQNGSDSIPINLNAQPPAPNTPAGANLINPEFEEKTNAPEEPSSPDMGSQTDPELAGSNSNGQTAQPINSQMASLSGPGLQQEMQAYKQQAGAEAQLGKAESQAIQNAEAQINQLPKQSDIIAQYKDKDNQLFNQLQSQKIDPKHYWQDHSKVTAGIGVLLSAFGQALGSQNGNQALQAIDQGIDKDIESQKNAQENTLNLWKMNREALGTDLGANLATKNQYYTMLQYELQKAAAQSKGPLANAAANLHIAELQREKDANNFKISLLNPTSDNPDPASRIQFLVPGERQQKVVDEINAAKATVENAPGILEAFDQASKEVRPLTGGPLGTSLTAFVPGMKSPGQKALQARLGPTFQNVEGTVRQAAMDNLEHNTTPELGDNDETVATKRESLIKYLTSKAAETSASKSFGIDLSRFPSTNTAAIAQMKPQSEKNVTIAGKPYTVQIHNGKRYGIPVK